MAVTINEKLSLDECFKLFEKDFNKLQKELQTYFSDRANYDMDHFREDEEYYLGPLLETTLQLIQNGKDLIKATNKTIGITDAKNLTTKATLLSTVTQGYNPGSKTEWLPQIKGYFSYQFVGIYIKYLKNLANIDIKKGNNFATGTTTIFSVPFNKGVQKARENAKILQKRYNAKKYAPPEIKKIEIQEGEINPDELDELNSEPLETTLINLQSKLSELQTNLEKIQTSDKKNQLTKQLNELNALKNENIQLKQFQSSLESRQVNNKQRIKDIIDAENQYEDLKETLDAFPFSEETKKQLIEMDSYWNSYSYYFYYYPVNKIKECISTDLDHLEENIFSLSSVEDELSRLTTEESQTQLMLDQVNNDIINIKEKLEKERAKLTRQEQKREEEEQQQRTQHLTEDFEDFLGDQANEEEIDFFKRFIARVENYIKTKDSDEKNVFVIFFSHFYKLYLFLKNDNPLSPEVDQNLTSELYESNQQFSSLLHHVQENSFKVTSEITDEYETTNRQDIPVVPEIYIMIFFFKMIERLLNKNKNQQALSKTAPSSSLSPN